MDKIKYVKLEQPDGSYSDNIPLAVDSNYVDVNGTNLNDKLNTLASKSEVQALASGSPLVASNISGMIDTTKTYVNTTDGYWYYYDGSAWTQGGLYQAAGIGEKTVKVENTDFITSSNLLPAFGWIYGKVFNVASGYEQNYQGSLNRQYIEVEPGDKLVFIKGDAQTIPGIGSLHIYFYNIEKEYVSQKQCKDDDFTEVPENCYFVRYSFWNSVDMSNGLSHRDGVLLNWNNFISNNERFDPTLEKDNYVLSDNVLLGDKENFIKVIRYYGFIESTDTLTRVDNNKIIYTRNSTVSSGTRNFCGPYFIANFEPGDFLSVKLFDYYNISKPNRLIIYNKALVAMQSLDYNSTTDAYEAIISQNTITNMGSFPMLLTTFEYNGIEGATKYSVAIQYEIKKQNSLTLTEFYNENKESLSEIKQKVFGIAGYYEDPNTVYDRDNKIWDQSGRTRNQPGGNRGSLNISSKEVSKIKITGYGWNGEEYGYWLYAFKNAAGEIIERYKFHAQGVVDFEITEIPENASQILVNGNSNYQTKIEIYENHIPDFKVCYDIIKKEEENPKTYKAMYLGDSITALTGNRAWWTYVNQMLNVTEYQNVAVAGARLMDYNDTVYDGNPVFDGPDHNHNNVLGNQVQKIIEHYDEYVKPDFIMIAIGTNGGINTDKDTAYSSYYDAQGAIVPIADVDRQTSAGAFRYCSEKLHELYPNAMIVWCTPIHAVNTTRNAKSIMTYADNLKMLCDLGSYYCIDTIKCGINGLHEISGQNGEDLIDGLHPNAHGAKKMGIYNGCKMKKFL